MTTASIGRYRWTICALLFVATTINYLDRQVLSLLKPTLEEQFGWTNVDYANITSVFQFTYAISMLFAGRIIDRLGTGLGFTLAIIVWSVGALLHAIALPIGGGMASLGFTAFSVSIMGFMVARAVLAFGEAGNFPAAIKATAEYFPKRERSLATGIFNSGANVGAILAPIVVLWLKDKYGWESAFIAVGAVGFLWLIFWWWFYAPPARQRRMSASELAYINQDEVIFTEEAVVPETRSMKWLDLLSFPQTWAFALGKFLTDGVWWFFLFWLPAYLKDQFGMSSEEMRFPLAILYSLTMIGSIGGGWLPLHFIRKGMPVFAARLKAMLLIAIVPLVVLLAQPLGQYSFWLPVLLIGIGASAHQAWSANIFTTVSDLFPKRAVASVVGIGGMAGGIGGVLITQAGGKLFDYYKGLGHISTGYSIMFGFCAVAYLLAWVCIKTLTRNAQPIQ